MKHTLTRRQFLHVSTTAAMSVLLASCGKEQPPTPVPQTTGEETAAPAKAEATAAETAAPTKAAEAPAEATDTPVPQATDTPAPKISSEPGAFVNDPNSGRDFNLADFEQEYGVQLTEFNESPMLKELVDQGKLPPVKERLPENPVVSIPLMEIGKYGGELHWVEFTIDYDVYLRHMNQVSLLELRPQKGTARYKWLGGEIMPGVFESWTVSDDATTYTFTIRKGLKWSDGQPVTTEDIRYCIEEVLLNEEITPITPTWLKFGGTPTKFEVLDEYTVRFTFGQPYGFFLPQLVNWAWDSMIRPSHYLKKFHTKYTDIAELTPLIEKAEFTAEEWARWYLTIDNNRSDGEYQRRLADYRDMPVLQPYIWESEPQQGEFIMVRNPYFYKVDPLGNQLPYIDKVSRSLVTDLEEAMS